MQNKDKLVPSVIKLDAPIDFTILKREVAENGPLRISRPNSPYVVYLTPTPCRCGVESCEAELVMVSRQHGFFEMQWVLSKEDLLEFDSIDSFYEYVVMGNIQDSRGERMIIERHIDRVWSKIEKSPHDLSCACADCLAIKIGEDARNYFMLSQLSNLLIERDDLLRDAREWDDDNTNQESGSDIADECGGRLEDWIESALEIGYALGRNFSEYSGKAQIEPLAKLGLEAKFIKEKREIEAGKKSRRMKEERRSVLFRQIETLVSRNPDIAKFASPDMVAKFALEECVKINPRMWKQGSGQIKEYLADIRCGNAGPEMQKRYQAIFGNKPPKRF